MLRRRRIRLTLIAAGIVIGLALIVFVLARPADPIAGTPLDIEWVDDHGYASVAEGQILRLSIDGDVIRSEIVAEGLAFPRGLAVIGDTLYIAELGDLPCENPFPRCKGGQVGPTTAEGERAILAESAGRILAYPIGGGGLGDAAVLVDDLSFVNTDHGLNDLDAGPDGQLYLSVGNLDELAWNDDGAPPDGEQTALLGSVLRIDPDTGKVDVFASGLRNVYGLAFDEGGALWGVDNDGRGRGVWRHEELLRIEEGVDYGFPDDGTVGPYTRRTGFAAWIMPTGAGSSGITVDDGLVISGACGRITRVELDADGGDASETQVRRAGCATAVERLPDGRLMLGTVLGGDPFVVIAESDLFDD